MSRGSACSVSGRHAPRSCGESQIFFCTMNAWYHGNHNNHCVTKFIAIRTNDFNLRGCRAPAQEMQAHAWPNAIMTPCCVTQGIWRSRQPPSPRLSTLRWSTVHTALVPTFSAERINWYGHLWWKSRDHHLQGWGRNTQKMKRESEICVRVLTSVETFRMNDSLCS